jgi:transcriptional regulator with XRE-family HTH domain
METREQVREFLTSRRAKITPQEAGLAAYGGNRRVKGLRRHEVALLAGVSVEYYAKLERGNLAGVSDSVLEAVARALRLNEAEHAHLLDLAKTANRRPRPTSRRAAGPQVRPGVQRLLETITDGPAFVRNGRLDVLAINDLGRALYAPVFANPANRDNLARFRFLDPASYEFYPAGDDSASVTANLLRTEAGRDPYNADLTELIGELCTRSEEFRTLWATHDVRLHHTGVKYIHHPVVGDLALAFEAMPLPADPGLTLTAYHAEPGTASYDGLRLLAVWAVSERAPALPDPLA